jgi:hypothetical protein
MQSDISEKRAKRAEYMREYVRTHPAYHESSIQRSKDYWHDNHDELLRKQNDYHANHREKRNEAQRRRHRHLRELVLTHYGSKCSWPGCDVTDLDMLQIDHVSGNGCKQRKELGSGGRGVMLYIVNNNFPEGFRILCANHNWKHRANLEREKAR